MANNAQPQKSNFGIFILIGIVVLILALAAYFLLRDKPDSSDKTDTSKPNKGNTTPLPGQQQTQQGGISSGASIVNSISELGQSIFDYLGTRLSRNQTNLPPASDSITVPYLPK